MSKTISKLTGGEKLRLKFHGSKTLGNEPYELDVTFLGFDGVERNAAFFQLGDEGTNDQFKAYKLSNRWAYGTSSEKLTIVS